MDDHLWTVSLDLWSVVHDAPATKDDRGQMLLATGVVLMMSLLSMAIFGVKMAGISMPYDTQVMIRFKHLQILQKTFLA